MFAVAAGVLTTPVDSPLPERLAALRLELRSLVRDLGPQVIVVERVFFQTNARTAMSVGQASGVALLTAAESGCTIAEYTSNEVKLAVAGHGGADKAQVQAMVARLLGLPEVPRPPDAADALALAICHVTTLPLREAAARADAAIAAQGERGAATRAAAAMTAAGERASTARVERTG